MRYRIARFRVRKAEVAAAEKAIIEFVAKVADEPGTLRYESFREPDGVSFVHLMAFADEGAQSAHEKTEHQKKFRATLTALCEAEPESTDLRMVSGAGR